SVALGVALPMDQDFWFLHRGGQVDQLHLFHRRQLAALARLHSAEFDKNKRGKVAATRADGGRLQPHFFLSQWATRLPGAAGGLWLGLLLCDDTNMEMPALFPYARSDFAVGGIAVA